MTEFDLSEIGLHDDDEREEVHQKIREWAKEKKFTVFTEEDHGGRPVTIFKVGEFRRVVVDPYGNVTIEKFANLGGDNGTIKLTENSFIVEDSKGKRSIVSEKSFPIHKS